MVDASALEDYLRGGFNTELIVTAFEATNRYEICGAEAPSVVNGVVQLHASIHRIAQSNGKGRLGSIAPT